MPKLSSLLDEAGNDGSLDRSRPIFSALLLLIPVLGFAVLAFGMQAQSGLGGRLDLRPQTLEVRPRRCEQRRCQLRAIAEARREIRYWQCKTNGPGPIKASDRVKLRNWECGYRQRCALLVRLYDK